ncbi:unnamed protein product [Cochlearia groenlandica]
MTRPMGVKVAKAKTKSGTSPTQPSRTTLLHYEMEGRKFIICGLPTKGFKMHPPPPPKEAVHVVEMSDEEEEVVELSETMYMMRMGYLIRVDE